MTVSVAALCIFAAALGPSAVLGRLHPLVLHAPLGALAALLVFETVAWFLGLEGRRLAAGVLVWFAALSAAVSVATGLVLALEGNHPEANVASHRNATLAFTAALWAAAVCHVRAALKPGPGRSALYGAAVLLTSVLAVPAGHTGASLTHGEGYWTAPFGRAAGSPPAESPSPIAGAEPWERVGALSILAARCSPCHIGGERKGRLSLEDRDSIVAGGKSGPGFDSSNPGSSILLTRIRRGIDERGHMPPKDKPQLTAAELQEIERWIFAGLTDPTPEASPRPDDHSSAGPPLPAEGAIAALRDRFVHVEALPGAPGRLRIELAAGARQLDADEVVALLGPVSANIVELTLDRGHLGGGLGGLLAGMPLTRLELRETEADDALVGAMAGHATLEVLVLTQTQVSDASIDVLAALPALRRVYLWDSRVTAEGIARLRGARPALRVDAGDTPDAASEAPAGAPDVRSPATPAAVNSVCPVSGKPADPAYTIVHRGRAIAFCCARCPATFWENPERHLANLPK